MPPQQFFPYFGCKLSRARIYPPPRHATVIEPFCGGAGYSTKYRHLNVILSDTDPVVVATWDYLIRAKSSELRRLPAAVYHIDDFPKLVQEAKWLIGWWLFRASARPRRRLSSWYSTRPLAFWGAGVRDRLSEQVEQIRHWRVSLHSYDRCPPYIGCWFVDPPYTEMGHHYAHPFDEYESLAEWCGRRRGQVIVCERRGADWMPFAPLPGDDAEVYYHRPDGVNSYLLPSIKCRISRTT
jgi:hypothetical protein